MILTRGMSKIIREWNQPGYLFLTTEYSFYLKDFLTWPHFFIDPGDVCCMWRPKGKGRSSRLYDAHSPITIYKDYHVLCTKVDHDQEKVSIEQYNQILTRGIK